ncbi:biotin--[acetyl-CoA-carboxylase] ligase [Enterococcus gallinarum]|uniref:Bifunctional ligase/repressor BirA n=1 Tax=Enterococcus gallinarum TaxID=1353 RepID=A0A376H060_ENTGA|nr:biotin--[acetyl-CoA-carboxylase] ligase [Enterococcus gallinarum]STD71686.1 biotin-[acetyl-CoA-carboxylase] ligase [Enterococcus gallinarum]STD83686.1 biotin-[acetyl-CoA-carboxylase] ligase [Enterococcus gallinarum]
MTTREKILALLQQETSVLSGEKIAQKLDISRTAVWKAIKELEKKGYHFEHSANGYRYLSADRYEQRALQEALPMVATIQIADQVETTMKEAKLAALSELSTPALFLSETQVGGHGRFNRPFFSPKGKGIYMSLLLKPNHTFSELPQYTLLAAVAVAQAIDELTGKETQIKWVNDIYLEGKKVCGILSEATSDFESGRIASIVIGIGINFAIPQAAFPEDIQQKATSLFPSGEAPVNRARLITAVWTRFFDLLDQLPADDYLTIYRQKSFVLGKTVCFTQQGIRYEGVAESITATGELVVRTTDDVKVLSSGEISLEKYS